MRFSSLLTGLLLSTCLILPAQAGKKLYKWVDDQGHVHYSDKIPPEDVRRSYNALDERGMTLETVEPAKTAEQIRKEREMARLRAERQRLIEKQKTADRVLLRSFRTEDDILLTRDGQLQAIDAYIKLARGNIKRLKLKLEALQRQAASLELSGKTVSKRLKDEISAKNRALKESYESIVHREHDKDRIRKAFAKDQKRFRELKQLEAGNDPLKEAQQSMLKAMQNVYDCGTSNPCDGPWKLAKGYMKRYITTPITMDADNILMSGNPTQPEDISITLSRIKDPSDEHTLIFMDLQCKDSPQGERLCRSDQVKSIIAGFQPALGQRRAPSP